MTSSIWSDSSQHRKNNSIKRLLHKLSFHIGHSCRIYISRIFENDNLSDLELEILERIFTMGLYCDEAIETACSTACQHQVCSVVDFNFLVSDVNQNYYEYDSEGKVE